MPGAKNGLIRAHRDNIRRYHRLLQTSLTDLERAYIQTRLSEETSALQSVFECTQFGGCGCDLETRPE